jgi:hypothetical protein
MATGNYFLINTIISSEKCLASWASFIYKKKSESLFLQLQIVLEKSKERICIIHQCVHDQVR